jgi:NADH:ubiquinone oxidoreductase subunit 5 (subunit L)/multisubunit Na+/H+ antiporter MnhA subunit
VPTETVTTTNERLASEEVPEILRGRDDDALRKLALRHLEHVRKFKLYLSAYVLSMLVLTPVWIVTQYETADGWIKHLSTRSRYPGDWDPWIIWVALIGAFLVALAGFRAYFSRADTEGEIEREVARLKSTR